MEQKQRLAILVGGGPAPGINSVIAAATIRARLEGLDVIEQVTRARREQRSAETPRVEAVLARELEWLRKWAGREALRRPCENAGIANDTRAAES